MSTNGLLFIVDPSIYDVEVNKTNVINGDLLRPTRFIERNFEKSTRLLLDLISNEKPEKIVFNRTGVGKTFYETFMSLVDREKDVTGITIDSFGNINYLYENMQKKEEKIVKKGLTEIYFILDKSGSMNSIKDDAIGGFNNFVEEQMKNDGETRINLILFDTNIEVRNDVTKLDSSTYQPSGLTSLLDAIGTGLEHMNSKLKNTPQEEHPENIIFTIMTDGQENSSREYTKDTIEKLIKEKTEQDWQFIFLGANIDSVSTAKDLGINGAFAGNFVAKGDGGSKAMLHASEMVTTYRASGAMPSYDITVNISQPEKSASDIAKEISDVLDKQLKKVNKGQ